MPLWGNGRPDSFRNYYRKRCLSSSLGRGTKGDLV